MKISLLKKILIIFIISILLVIILLFSALLLFRKTAIHRGNVVMRELKERSNFQISVSEDINELYKYGIYDVFSAITKKAKNNSAFKEDLQRAFEKFNKIIKLDKDSPLGYKGFAETYYLSGDYEEAILNYKSALQLDASDFESWRRLGVIYKEINSLEEAMECFKEAKKIGEKNRQIFFSEEYKEMLKTMEKIDNLGR